MCVHKKLIVMCAFLHLFHIANAQFGFPVYEPFSEYPEGERLRTAGISGVYWNFGNSVSSTTSPLVSTNYALSYPGLFVGPAPARGLLGAQGTGRTCAATYPAQSSGTNYLSFLIKLLTLPSADRPIIGLHANASGTPTPSSGPSVWVTPLGQLKIDKGNATTPLTNTTAALPLGSTNLVVMAYDFQNGQVDLWLNPTNLGNNSMIPPPDLSSNSGPNPAQLQSLCLYSGSTIAISTNVFDEIRVGFSWADVTPAAFTGNIYDVTGGGFGNLGDSFSVGLSGSDTSNVVYLLFANNVYTGQALNGTGSALDFGLHSNQGNYTVLSSNVVSGEFGWMNGLASIVIVGWPVRWINAAGGNWNSPTNWDSGMVPGIYDGVVITNAGTYTVTLNVNASVAKLTLGGPSGVQTLSDSGNTLTLNGESTVDTNGLLYINGGTLAGSGDLTVNGAMSLMGVPTMTGSGLLNVNGTLNLVGLNSYYYMDGRRVSLGGQSTWQTASYFYLNNGAVLTNRTGATITFMDNSTIYGDGTGRFYNQGTVIKGGGSGGATITAPSYNSGTIEVQSGGLSVERGEHTGAFLTDAGTSLTLTSSSDASTNNLLAGSSVSGAGSVTFGRGVSQIYGTYDVTNGTGVASLALVYFNPGCNLLNLGNTVSMGVGELWLNSGNPVTVGNWTMNGGKLGGGDSVTVNGAMSLMGVPTMTGSGLLNVNGTLNLVGLNSYYYMDGRPISLGGLSTWQTASYFYLNNGAVLTNRTGATITFMDNSTIYGDGTGRFYNQGTVIKGGGSGGATITAPSYNSGTVEVQSGELLLIAFASNAPSSALSFPIGGPSLGSNYGRLVVSGALPLAGTLNVALTNGFLPSAGDTFRIITWGSKKGGFSQANGFDLGNGLYFQGIAEKSGLSLVTKSSVVPTPPPHTNLVDEVVAFGDTALFSFSPVGVEPLSYQWTFYGTNLPGQTSANLVITNVQLANLGPYCALVVDALNVSNLYCATLSATNPPSISGQPTGVTTNLGANITLTATASGGAPLRYQWRLNGQNIPDATNSTYTITNAQPRDGGIYSVLVANPVRVISSSNAKVKINTNNLPFADNFASRGTLNGMSGVGSGSNTVATYEIGEPYHADKYGSNSVWLQWTPAASGVAAFNTRGSDFDTLLGIYQATNGSPAVSNLAMVVSDDDRGDYFTSEALFNAAAGTNYYIVVDGLSGGRGDIVLTWSLDTNITEIPRIIQQPNDVTTGQGGDATFDVFAVSTTNLTYQWILGGWLAFTGRTNATLNLTNVGPTDVGAYSVEVSSATGQRVISLPASLEIGPGVDVHSYDKLEDLLAETSGGGVHLFSLSSFPSVSVGTIGSQIINNFNSTTQQGEPIHSATIGGSSRWYLLTALTNGTMLVDTLGSDIDTVLSVYVGSDIFSLALVAQDNNGASDGVRSLVLFPVTGGTSYLIAVDGVNGAQGNINLNWRMGIPPNTVGPAESLTLSGGEGLELKSGVSDDVTSPWFQWRRNGVNIPGATNESYTITALQFNEVGSYSVLVSNLIAALINPIATISAQTPLKLSNGTNGYQLSGSATQAVVLNLSTNLTLWTPLYTNTTPLLPVSYVDTNAPSRSKGFYKLSPWP